MNKPIYFNYKIKCENKFYSFKPKKYVIKIDKFLIKTTFEIKKYKISTLRDKSIISVFGDFGRYCHLNERRDDVVGPEDLQYFQSANHDSHENSWQI